MQDRFTFRAWDKACNNMISFEKDEKYFFKFKMSLAGTLTYLDVACTKDLILMQCAGFKDKNGKLIFEGDIVNYNVGRKDINFSVRWAHNICGFFLHSSPYCYYKFESISSDWLEVVGNIYENPELLEGKN